MRRRPQMQVPEPGQIPARNAPRPGLRSDLVLVAGFHIEQAGHVVALFFLVLQEGRVIGRPHSPAVAAGVRAARGFAWPG